MIIKAKYGQSLMDLAVQLYGSAAALVDLANDNGLALDAEIVPGQELTVRDDYPESALSIFANYIKENNIVVVSGDAGTVQVLITDGGEALATNNNNGIGI